MNTITRFQCSLCGAEYETADACQKCEDEHVKDPEIVETGYNRMDFKMLERGREHRVRMKDSGRYPAYFICHFSEDQENSFAKYVLESCFTNQNLAEILTEEKEGTETGDKSEGGQDDGTENDTSEAPGTI